MDGEVWKQMSRAYVDSSSLRYSKPDWTCFEDSHTLNEILNQTMSTGSFQFKLINDFITSLFFLSHIYLNFTKRLKSYLIETAKLEGKGDWQTDEQTNKINL